MCWRNIQWIGPISYRNIILLLGTISENKTTFCKKNPKKQLFKGEANLALIAFVKAATGIHLISISLVILNISFTEINLKTENNMSKITVRSPRGQWVNEIFCSQLLSDNFHNSDDKCQQYPSLTPMALVLPVLIHYNSSNSATQHWEHLPGSSFQMAWPWMSPHGRGPDAKFCFYSTCGILHLSQWHPDDVPRAAAWR